MTVEELHKKGWIIYECIAGSHAYGTNIEGSDIDKRRVFVQPTEDVAEKKELIIKRPEREYLLSIRNGKLKYDELLDNADKMVNDIAMAFENGGLPKEVDRNYQEELLLKIRKDNL